MNAKAALLHTLHANPADETSWLVLADCLEEEGQPLQGELLRLSFRLRGLKQGPVREECEAQLRELLAQGVQPCWPCLVNSLGMDLMLIPAGTFRMGSKDCGRENDESPCHDVDVSQPFYLGRYQVTQAEFNAVMAANPSYFNSGGEGRERVSGLETDRYPVEMVTWYEAVHFCQLLSERPEERRAGRVYRLPTEAEWEYACRGAGVYTTPFAFGWVLSSDQANFDGNHPWGSGRPGPYLQRPTRVGSYPANALGLCDLHGNVCEWCSDWYHPEAYLHAPRRDPRGPARGTLRSLRGGSWFSPGSSCRASYRSRHAPAERSFIVGFRVACVQQS